MSFNIEKARRDPSISRFPVRLLDSYGIARKHQDRLGFIPLLNSYDLTGRATVCLGITPLNIDLIVQNVTLQYQEHAQITPHVGDTYSSVFFGKAPIQAVVTAMLPDYTNISDIPPATTDFDYQYDPDADTPGNFGKVDLMDYYKNYLRLTAVTMRDTMPRLVYKNSSISGPWVSLDITETSDMEDHILVSITILALQISMSGDDSDVNIDFNSGMILKDTLGNTSTIKVQEKKKKP